MGFPFYYSLLNSEYLVHPLLCPKMIGLISSSEFVSEEIILKVIRRDIVIRFNSLTFSWTSLSGFQSPGIPFLPKSPFWVFNLPGVQIFCFIPNICLNRPFGFSIHRDAFVLPRCVNLAGLLYVISFDYVCVCRVWQVVAVNGV